MSSFDTSRQARGSNILFSEKLDMGLDLKLLEQIKE